MDQRQRSIIELARLLKRKAELLAQLDHSTDAEQIRQKIKRIDFMIYFQSLKLNEYRGKQ